MSSTVSLSLPRIGEHRFARPLFGPVAPNNSSGTCIVDRCDCLLAALQPMGRCGSSGEQGRPPFGKGWLLKRDPWQSH